MKQLTGDLKVNGKLALVSQQAWIFNTTLRENVIFGGDFDQAKFDKVIKACNLESDLKLLSNGDLTEIGERGVNLSGGQKQRVNLARALYSEADIYLLDDPLSALDAKVAKSVFQEYVKGALKDMTVILVTHGMQVNISFEA